MEQLAVFLDEQICYATNLSREALLDSASNLVNDAVVPAGAIGGMEQLEQAIR